MRRRSKNIVAQLRQPGSQKRREVLHRRKVAGAQLQLRRLQGQRRLQSPAVRRSQREIPERVPERHPLGAQVQPDQGAGPVQADVHRQDDGHVRGVEPPGAGRDAVLGPLHGHLREGGVQEGRLRPHLELEDQVQQVRNLRGVEKILQENQK